MDEIIAQMRELLTQLEANTDRGVAATQTGALTGLELPDIICDVVDLLLPELKPYEAAFYLYMLRHSIVRTGKPFCKISRRGMQGIVQSAYSGSKKGITKESSKGGPKTVGVMSYNTVQVTLKQLQEIGAVRQDGEPNNDGTLYRVFLPAEIEVCERRRASRTRRADSRPLDTNVDFYNIKENRLKVYERDDYKCNYCDKQLTQYTATLDHVVPVKEGGDNSAGNLVTSCLQCNSRKNSRPVGEFLADK